MVIVFLVRRNACRMKKLATIAQEKSKSKVTICPATTHILNVSINFQNFTALPKMRYINEIKLYTSRPKRIIQRRRKS